MIMLNIYSKEIYQIIEKLSLMTCNIMQEKWEEKSINGKIKYVYIKVLQKSVYECKSFIMIFQEILKRNMSVITPEQFKYSRNKYKNSLGIYT